MFPRYIFWIGSAAFGLLGWGLPIAYPNLDPWWGKAALVVAGLLLLVALLSVFYSLIKHWRVRKSSERANGIVSEAKDRITLTDFIDQAKNAGWDVSGKNNLQIMDLLDGLHQAGSDGAIIFYGRMNRNDFESLARAERLISIPVMHWIDFQIDLSAVMYQADNFKTQTYNPRQLGAHSAGSFIDIHLDREMAIRWLGMEASKYKGARDAVKHRRQ